VDISNVDVAQVIKFSYSVEWVQENLVWEDRMSKYIDSSFLPTNARSIISSFVVVLLLTAFLMIIMLQELDNDFARYMDLDDETLEEEEVR